MTWKKFHAPLALLVATATAYGTFTHDWQWIVVGVILFAAILIPLTYDKLVVKVVLKNDGSEVTVDASRVES